jgi:hypothetical protein
LVECAQTVVLLQLKTTSMMLHLEPAGYESDEYTRDQVTVILVRPRTTLRKRVVLLEDTVIHTWLSRAQKGRQEVDVSTLCAGEWF